VGCLGAVLGGFTCLGCLGFVAPIKVAFYLVFGWVGFLGRTVRQVGVNWMSVLTAAICLVGLSWGLHLFLAWFVAESRKPPEGEGPAGRWKARWTLVIVGGIVLAFAAGIAAVGVTHQTAWLATSREPLVSSGSRLTHARINSLNNLKQMALATHNYVEIHNHLPPGGTFDAQGRGLHGWQTLLLPFLEQDNLYKQINLNLPWDHPDNAEHFRHTVWLYVYAGAEMAPANRPALSHYAGNAHVLGGDKPVSFEQIQAVKGLSQTLLLGEAAGNFKPWGSPANWRDPAAGLNRGPNGFGNPVNPKRAVIFAFADGTVRTFSSDTDPEFLELLALPNPRR
jgi:hypothetical protein